MTVLPYAVSAFADLTDGTIECVKLTDEGAPKLLLRFHKDSIATEIRLTPAQAGDFAVELQEVLDWLGAS